MGTPKDFDSPLVREHMNKAADYLRTEAPRRFLEEMNAFVEITSPGVIKFDSPLELSFFVWWCALASLDPAVERAILCSPQTDAVIDGRAYRFDFFIEPGDAAMAKCPEWVPIVVEVDGHAFHEKTTQQVVRRNERDRALQMAGWKVFHYSFVEFVSNPVKCVQEVMDLAMSQWSQANMAHFKASKLPGVTH